MGHQARVTSSEQPASEVKESFQLQPKCREQDSALKLPQPQEGTSAWSAAHKEGQWGHAATQTLLVWR